MRNIERHAQLAQMLTETYKKKNADYGNSFHKGFLEYGGIMPLIRIEDKFNRYKHLATHKETERGVVDESMCDTLFDLANYCLMTIMELEGENGDAD